MGTGGRRRVIALATALVIVLGSLAIGDRAEAADAVTPSTRWQQELSGRLTMPAGSDAAGAWPMRNYHVYVPSDLPPRGERSVVVYLPGTTQTAIDAANGVLWNDLADKEHFIVVYPEEATTAESGSMDDGSSDLRGWSWGRAAYETRGSGEGRTIERITRKVMDTYGADPGRVFIGGASAGAIMATVMGATYPDLYSAVGSWAGCNYLCLDPTGAAGYERMGEYARVVPHIMFAGTADYTVNPALTLTGVLGVVGMNDLADDGLPNNSITRTPTFGINNYNTSVRHLKPGPNPDVTNNGCRFAGSNATSPCPGGWLDWKGYPYSVAKYAYLAHPKDVVVESWIIHLQSHNVGGANPEGSYVDALGPDTTGPAWRFFKAHAR